MTANERRAEIMRILIARRFETEGRLAVELSVSRRTIHSDILTLSAEYPLETSRGYRGGVRLSAWYHPHHSILSQEQQAVLEQFLPLADDTQRRVLCEIILEYGVSGRREKSV